MKVLYIYNPKDFPIAMPIGKIDILTKGKRDILFFTDNIKAFPQSKECYSEEENIGAENLYVFHVSLQITTEK